MLAWIRHDLRCASFSCGGGESSEQVPTSPIVFETAIVNLGEMVPDATQTLSVKVKNVSSLPQSIEKVISDCSCAEPTWTDEPIAPVPLLRLASLWSLVRSKG